MKNRLKIHFHKMMLYNILVCFLIAKGSNDEAQEVINNIEYNVDSEKEINLEIQKNESIQTLKKSYNTNQIPDFAQVKERESKFIEIPSVVANENVNIRKSPAEDGELAGKLVEGHTLELLEELDNGWDKVLYYDEIRYVNSDYVSKTTTYQVNGDIQKLCYVPKGVDGVELTVPAKVSESKEKEIVTVPTFEFFEVYEETEDSYLVQTNDYIGYVKKTSLEELAGTIAIVDISDQEFKFYLDNKIVIDTPVITGQPSKGNSTHEGLFEIYDISETGRYLIGKNANGETTYTYVDAMMKFYGNEGFHDAEHHYCDNGKQDNHGWRDEYQFGGDTYLVNGSHGCVNMPHDDAMMLYGYVEEGTPTLIKK